MYRYSDKLQLNIDLHLTYQSYFYNTTVSDKFRNYYITGKLSELKGIKSYDYYIKLRQLILTAIYRFKRIFTFNSMNDVLLVQDVIKDYILKYYADKNQDVSGLISEHFAQITLDDDPQLYVYSTKEAITAMMDTVYNEITFTTNSGEATSYLNSTLIDAIAIKLSDLMFTWDSNVDASFKNYYKHYTEYYLKSNQLTMLHLDPNYEYKIIDVLNNLDEYSFNADKHDILLSRFTIIPKINQDDSYNRLYYDVLGIVQGNPSTEVQEILQTGHDILEFNLFDKEDKNPLLISKISEKISNLDINTQVKFNVFSTNNSIKIEASDTCPNQIPVILRSFETKKLVNPLPNITEIMTNTKKFFLKSITETVRRSIDSTLFEKYSKIFNDTIESTVLNVIKSIILGIEIPSINIDVEAIKSYLDDFDSTKIFAQVEQYSTKVVTKLTEQQGAIAESFKQSIYNNTGVEINLTTDFTRLFKQQLSKQLMLFEMNLKYYVKFLEYGYYGKNFNNCYFEFVKIFFNILSPILTIDNQDNIDVTGIIKEIKEYLVDYLSEIMVGYYFAFLSDYDPFKTEYITTPTYTNYTNNIPTKIDLMYTTLIGNRSLIYPMQSIEMAQQDLFEKRYLKLASSAMFNFINTSESKNYINFIKGTYSVKDNDLHHVLDNLNYKYDFTVTKTMINNYSKSLSVYPDYIYDNKGIILFNYSEFINDGYDKGYYFSYNLSQYLTKPILDKIVDQLQEIDPAKYSKKILVSDNINPQYLTYTTYDPNYFIRSDNNLCRLGAVDIIRSLTYDYILSLTDNFIFTDLDSAVRTKILEYLSLYKSFDSFKLLNYLDLTGRDFYSLSYNYRLYLTFESIVSETVTQDVVNYEIINTYNLTTLLKSIKTTDLSVPTIIKRILGL